MSALRPSTMTRRNLLGRLAAATGAGALALYARPAAAEPPPEVRRIGLMKDPDVPVLCYAPQYLVEEFLRLEGFRDVHYVPYGIAISDTEVLTLQGADLAAGLGSDFVAGVDARAPIVILSGLHAGCVEIFANDRVRDLRDLAGKRIAITGQGGPEHLFVSSVVAYIGRDPARDVEWVEEPDYAKWPEMLESGQVDVVNAFPPNTYHLRDKKIGHVILNTTTDDPWRHFFCCMVAARREFVERYPVAAKRALRALIKANQFCQTDKDVAARLLVERGATDREDYARRVLDEVGYGAWRDYDPRDTVRFFALRLREAGLVRGTPSEILARGTDFRYFDDLRRELKT